MRNIRLGEEKLVDTGWMVDAACIGHAALPWTENPTRVPGVLVDLMADVCASCPVRRECAAYVVDARITAGWWAGRSVNGFRHPHTPTAADMRGDAA